jgi:hypothetical protein
LDLRAVSGQFRSMVTATPSQLHLAMRPGWQEVLVSLLRELGRLQRQLARSGAEPQAG